MRGRWVLLGAALALLCLPAAAPARVPTGDGVGGVRLSRVGVFSDPVHVSAARAYPGLLFVVEREGVVRVVRAGKTLQRPFLDISSLVESNYQERGLLSVAFPPDYRSSRRFYVFYTDAEGQLCVDEFLRKRSDPTRALGSSRRRVITVPHPNYANHNGGQLQFHGAHLFIGTGDGGLAGDPLNNAQNRDSLLGKLLRIDPRRSKAGRPYRVPRANPYVGAAGRDEVFSYGLRNPYRFSIQDFKQEPDRVVVGDVGQTRFEEIDYEALTDARGANFGWDAYEGFELYNCGGLSCPSGGTPDPGGTTAPILAYGHGQGCAITGGLVVRDSSLASLYGRYLYADFCVGDLRSLIPTLAGASDDRALGVNVSAVSSFGETPNGRVYVCSLSGDVYRIVSS